jgi:hypothetical protein
MIELYRQSDLRLSAKLVPTFEGRGVSHVSAANHILFFFQIKESS